MEDRPPTDADLAIRARNGDKAAFSELVRRHTQIAYRVAYLVCRSAADAEDAAQEAFVKAYLALDRFRAGSEFRPWLLTIVGNEARNRLRSASRRHHYEGTAGRLAVSGDAVPSPERAAEMADARRTLLEAVERLPERERLVVGLRYLLDLSEKEASRIARIPRGTVKSRLHRAMRRLREELEEADDV